MSRLIVTFAVLAVVSGIGAGPALAQPDWEYRNRREAERERREQEREARREAREAAREAQRDARDARREAWRESWEWRDRDRDGVHLRMFRSYTLPAGQTAAEPIVVIGGSATIDGHAEDDVVVIGGNLRLGPQAIVDGNISAIGGSFDRSPTATVHGTIDQTTAHWGDFDIDLGSMPQGWWAAASLGAMFVRLGLILFASLLITWFAPGWTDSIGTRASSAAASSTVLGLATQLLFVPALILLCVVLVISIIGIPVLLAIPFVLAIAALAWTAGFAAVVRRIGARLRGQTAAASSSPTLDLLTGFFAVTALTVIAHFLALGPWWTRPGWFAAMAAGWLVEWLVWTVGLGAMLTSWAATRWSEPPPLPFTPQSAPSEL